MSYDPDKMEAYLTSLKEKIKRYSWGAMYVKGESKTLSPFLRDKTPLPQSKLNKLFQESPRRFANQLIAEIRMVCNPSKMHKNVDADEMTPWVLSIQVSINRTDDAGRMLTVNPHVDYWALILNLTPDDLHKKPFKLEFVQNMVKIAQKKIVTSSAAGLSMDEFRSKLETYKKKKKDKKKKLKPKPS
jgi:hypothetical protein